MKKIALAALLLSVTMVVPAYADVTSSAGASSGSIAGAQAQAGVQQASQAITFNSAPIPASSELTVRSAPPVMAPSLVTTMTETCMGSSSVGASGLAFGVTVGSTWTDDNCRNRLDARQLAAMGYADAARAVMCGNPVVREAFRATGNPCPGDQATKTKVSSSAGSSDQEYTDPIIRYRMGLPPLTASK